MIFIPFFGMSVVVRVEGPRPRIGKSFGGLPDGSGWRMT
jgi:hypothetical protein